MNRHDTRKLSVAVDKLRGDDVDPQWGILTDDDAMFALRDAIQELGTLRELVRLAADATSCLLRAEGQEAGT